MEPQVELIRHSRTATNAKRNCGTPGNHNTDRRTKNGLSDTAEKRGEPCGCVLANRGGGWRSWAASGGSENYGGVVNQNGGTFTRTVKQHTIFLSRRSTAERAQQTTPSRRRSAVPGDLNRERDAVSGGRGAANARDTWRGGEGGSGRPHVVSGAFALEPERVERARPKVVVGGRRGPVGREYTPAVAAGEAGRSPWLETRGSRRERTNGHASNNKEGSSPPAAGHRRSYFCVGRERRARCARDQEMPAATPSIPSCY